MTERSKRTLVGRLAWCVAGTAVALVALELVIDRWLPVGRTVYEPDADLLHDARPFAATIQPMARDRIGEGDSTRVHVRTGELGFRGGFDAEASEPRLLILGDSLVMAENVPDEATFVRRLEDELTLRFEAPIRALNAGRSGYGPDQALLLFERVAPTVRPDAVLVVLCAYNDFGDLYRNKLFRMDGDELVRRPARLGPRPIQRFNDAERAASDLALVRLVRFFRRTSSLESEVIEDDVIPLYLAALEAQYLEHLHAPDASVMSLFEDIYDVDLAMNADPERTGAKSKLMRAVLQRFVDTARARGVPIGFIVVPAAPDVLPEFGIAIDEKRYPSWEAGRLTHLLVRASEATGAPVLDLTETLTAARGVERNFVGGTDIHWNARGQRVGARGAAGWLAELPAFRDALTR